MTVFACSGLAAAAAGRGGAATATSPQQQAAARFLAKYAQPDGSQPQTQYGLDAQRVVVWFAASCDPQARQLAARWWPLLRASGRAQALALRLLRRPRQALQSLPAVLRSLGAC